jgi:magnesium chelatase family protein
MSESSEVIRGRVEQARQRQRVRFEGMEEVAANADMHIAEIRKFCSLDETGQALMRTAMNQMQLSARGYHRVLKLALTIADLAGSEMIQSVHLAEALQYRSRLMLA